MSRLFIVVLLCLTAALGVVAKDRVKLEGQVVCCAECWAEADRNKVEFGTSRESVKGQIVR